MTDTVYLLHFAAPLGGDKHQATHYIGWTNDLNKRMAKHRKGLKGCKGGANMTAALKERGITFDLVRSWSGSTRLEKYIKSRKDSKSLCPICNPAGWQNNCPGAVVPETFVYKPRRPFLEPVQVEYPVTIDETIPF